MRWRDIDLAVPSLADIAWSAPHTWRLSLRLASFCLVAVLSFACAWALGDSSEELELTRQQAQRLRASVEAAEIAAARLREFQAREQVVVERIEEGLQAFLLADELPDLLDLIASLSVERGVALESLEVEDVVSQQRLDLQPLKLSLRGSYRDIGFLHLDLTNLPWPMVVDELQVSTEQDDGRVLTMRVTLLVPGQV